MVQISFGNRLLLQNAADDATIFSIHWQSWNSQFSNNIGQLENEICIALFAVTCNKSLVATKNLLKLLY